MLSEDDLKFYQKTAEKLAVKAGKILLDYRKKFTIKKRKDGFLDIATDADYASEQYLIRNLRKFFPLHSILSEEDNGKQIKKSKYQWIIDPLDGTKEFIRRLAYYSVNIALEYRDQLIVGVVYEPELNRLYSASLHNETQLNGQIISASAEGNLDRSCIYFRLPDYRMPKQKIPICLNLSKNFIVKTYRVRNLAWDIECLCHVALGATEGFILPSTKDWHPAKWWDVAPGILMVEEAGGKVTDLYENPISNHDLTKGLIASNGKIHSQLLKIVRSYI